MKQLVEAHNRVKDLDWTPSYTVKPTKYPTKYVLPKKTKDPFRHLLREYFAMEQEKDNRQYGALEDALSRVDAAAQAEPERVELDVEAVAVRGCGPRAEVCSPTSHRASSSSATT